VALTGEIKRACSVLVGKLKNRPLGSFSNRWGDYVKTGLEQVGWEGVNWIDLDQNSVQRRALVKLAVEIRFP
jgi:hypothetical protein